MKYRFLHHTLDTKTSELSSQNRCVLLQQKPYLLLLCLVNHPQQILTKDFLLKEVWNDRLVSDNTISQTVAQLRQILGDDGKQPEIIITHRGRGISFTPDVITVASIPPRSTSDQTRQHKKLLIPAFIIAALGLLSMLWFNLNNNTETNLKAAPTSPNLLILSSQHQTPGSASDAWLQKSIPQIFSGLIESDYTGKISAEHLETKANVKTFLDKQWEFNPQLNVVTTELIQNEFGYVMTLKLTDQAQNEKSQRFSAKSVNTVISLASSWLGSEIDTQVSIFSEYLPDDAGVVELYMRGLAADNDSEYEKAAQYYELCLSEMPDFHLARLKLAGAKKQQGKFDDALVLLDTLESTAIFPKIELNVVEIRGYIYATRGRFDEAQTLFEETLEKQAQKPAHLLNPLRFELSYILTSLNQPEQALLQLDQILQPQTLDTDPWLYADALHKKASVLQSLGRTQLAEKLANEALNTYLKLDKLLGAAKVHSLLARIFTLKSDYEQAKYHLYETLNITKKLDYKLGTGASINELIYILIKEGAFDQAEEFITEMQEIAIAIEYTHMLIAVKQHAATLAIGRGNWQVAEQYLEQQIDLAHSSNNQTALMTGHFLKLEYLVAKGSNKGAQELLDWVDERIDPEQNPRQHIALELRRAQLKLIEGKRQEAINLLIIVKDLTEAVEDNESLAEVNNTLAEIYLPHQPKKALAVIAQNNNINAVAYPHLLILSKALQANNKLELSLAAAIECKNQSGQRWKRQDEAYLSKLHLLVN